jgi:Bax protein
VNRPEAAATSWLRLTAAVVLLALVLGATVLWRQPWTPVAPPPPPDPYASELPDHDIQGRKAAFFAWLAPVVAQENARLARTREHLQLFEARLAQGLDLRPHEQDQLLIVAAYYRVDTDADPATVVQELLRKVDTLPPRLALVQAAIESGWGESRFAREGHNYFGIWTWRSGGQVPQDRAEGAVHSVAGYPDAAAAVRAYLFTLNVGPAYADLRSLRAEARSQGRRPAAGELAAGLRGYSERGPEYVEEVRRLLRINSDLLDQILEGI